MTQTQRSPALVTPGLENTGHAGQAIPAPGDNCPAPPGQDRPLIDKHGHRHTTAILTAWSPQAIKVMGVRRLDGGAL